MAVGGGFESNAKRSKRAADASDAANVATGATKSGDFESHQRAADAHRDAAAAHQDAGNLTKADKHRAVAKVHQEKASAGNRAKYFADDESRAAETLTQKAEKSRFGKDPQEPRSEKQLHEDAAEAHARAAKAHELSGDEAAQKYHQAKAEAHQGFAGGQPEA
jgi:hypothetical protein